MQEVQDYMTFDEHQLSMVWLHCNNEWYQNLHPRYQRMLDEAGYRASVEGRQITRFYRRYGREFVANNGMQVHYPSDELIDNLRDKVKEPLDDTIRNEILDTPELMDDLQQALEDKREELAYDRFS